jgi:hypothetical protein
MVHIDIADYKAQIKALRAQVAEQWISVDDRLPECSTWVLITTTSLFTKERIASMAFFEDDESSGEIYWLDNNTSANLSEGWEDVTQWMEMPPPALQGNTSVIPNSSGDRK